MNNTLCVPSLTVRLSSTSTIA